MREFGQQLRKRAEQLHLSDTEVARRAGLNERRYGHYVTGTREPDLAALVRICRVLQTTPNAMLGFDDAASDDADNPITRQAKSAMAALNDEDAHLAVTLLRAIIDFRRKHQ